MLSCPLGPSAQGPRFASWHAMHEEGSDHDDGDRHRKSNSNTRRNSGRSSRNDDEEGAQVKGQQQLRSGTSVASLEGSNSGFEQKFERVFEEAYQGDRKDEHTTAHSGKSKRTSKGSEGNNEEKEEDVEIENGSEDDDKDNEGKVSHINADSAHMLSFETHRRLHLTEATSGIGRGTGAAKESANPKARAAENEGRRSEDNQTRDKHYESIRGRGDAAPVDDVRAGAYNGAKLTTPVKAHNNSATEVREYILY